MRGARSLPLPPPPMTPRRLVIFYGWLAQGPSGAPTAAACRIAAVAPDLVTAAAWTTQPVFDNLSGPVMALFREAGARVAAYIPIAYGRRDLTHVERDVRRVA
ncbi:MAG: hypothetical protein NZ518_01915, partial [Dehalococcoidia bacterium]|nr:hypothetical protein [Dehalococcoidia bacterium]